VAFDAVQVHCYSDMPDTEASTLGPKIDPATLRDRLEQMGRAGIRFDRAETRREWEQALADAGAAT
jgi:tRNA A37 methylthiotransferase MiaB